jgi:hypothetical protein
VYVGGHILLSCIAHDLFPDIICSLKDGKGWKKSNQQMQGSHLLVKFT